jgi:hypothetical protein
MKNNESNPIEDLIFIVDSRIVEEYTKSLARLN